MTRPASPQDHEGRIRAMLAPDQQTWDLSDNDVRALRWLMGERDRLRLELDVACNRLADLLRAGSIEEIRAEIRMEAERLRPPPPDPPA